MEDEYYPDEDGRKRIFNNKEVRRSWSIAIKDIEWMSVHNHDDGIHGEISVVYENGSALIESRDVDEISRYLQRLLEFRKKV